MAVYRKYIHTDLDVVARMKRAADFVPGGGGGEISRRRWQPQKN